VAAGRTPASGGGEQEERSRTTRREEEITEPESGLSGWRGGEWVGFRRLYRFVRSMAD
jgi:hypothetical protein